MARSCYVLIATAIAIATALPASAQEVGARIDRFEVTGFAVGGVFFEKTSRGNEPPFANFALGMSLTYKLQPWLGFEGEIGDAIGLRQDITLAERTLENAKTPSLLAYNGNIVVTPITELHGLVPYATGGIGGLTMLYTSAAAALGATSPVTYFTENLGGGLKWFATRHWGARGDYRLMIVNDKGTAPGFFGRDEIRLAHRVYGGLLFTY